MPARSRLHWPLLTAALIGLPVLYIASFGPACWISSHTLDQGDRAWAQALNWIYQPILSLAWSGPSVVQDPIRWYARVGSSHQWEIYHYSGRARWERLPF